MAGRQSGSGGAERDASDVQAAAAEPVDDLDRQPLRCGVVRAIRGRRVLGLGLERAERPPLYPELRSVAAGHGRRSLIASERFCTERIEL